MSDLAAPTVPAPSEPSGVGRRHGTSATQPFDRWFRYPAGFATDHVTKLMSELGLRSGSIVDCFAGSGVTGTAARSIGLGFHGIEAHPMIAELASIKLAVSGVTPSELVPLAKSLTNSAARLRASCSTESETDLVARSFDEATLGTLVTLRQLIVEREPDELTLYLKWALLATLRDVATVKVGWPYQLPSKPKQPRYVDVSKRFITRVEWMAEDLLGAPADLPPHRVVLGDSRTASSWPDAGSMSASISSPPYLNNFDYADATRLEAYFWGEVRSWKELTTSIRGEMITATTQQSSRVEKAGALAQLDNHPTFKAKVKALADELLTIRVEEKRGSKLYDQVTPAYFAAMDSILANLARSLEDGASCVWLIGDSAPYGVYIDTPALIGELAELNGFEVVADTLVRQRGNRWRSQRASLGAGTQLSERMLVFQKA